MVYARQFWEVFPIVECIILHSRLIAHLRNCNLLVGVMTLLKFALNMYFSERYLIICMQFPCYKLHGAVVQHCYNGDVTFLWENISNDET